MLNDDDAGSLAEELRGLADDGLARVRIRLEAVPPVALRELAVLLLAQDAARRAADSPEPEAVQDAMDPSQLAALLDDAAAVSNALCRIDDVDGLIRGVFDALSEAEVRLLVFEHALRCVVNRRRAG